MPRAYVRKWPFRRTRLGAVDRRALVLPIPYEVIESVCGETDDSKPAFAAKGQALSIDVSAGGMLLLLKGEPPRHLRLRLTLPTGMAPDGVRSAAACWTRTVPAFLKDGVHFAGVQFLQPG